MLLLQVQHFHGLHQILKVSKEIFEKLLKKLSIIQIIQKKECNLS